MSRHLLPLKQRLVVKELRPPLAQLPRSPRIRHVRKMQQARENLHAVLLYPRIRRLLACAHKPFTHLLVPRDVRPQDHLLYVLQDLFSLLSLHHMQKIVPFLPQQRERDIHVGKLVDAVYRLAPFLPRRVHHVPIGLQTSMVRIRDALVAHVVPRARDSEGQELPVTKRREQTRIHLQHRGRRRHHVRCVKVGVIRIPTDGIQSLQLAQEAV
mmetsp:Transcript_1548/g.5086  ORF Transcript_1548/g.5086 Transcript_1548/m.5086 type:complete len:212 (+) Transcript_1548:1247-1882(+)